MKLIQVQISQKIFLMKSSEISLNLQLYSTITDASVQGITKWTRFLKSLKTMILEKKNNLGLVGHHLFYKRIVLSRKFDGFVDFKFW